MLAEVRNVSLIELPKNFTMTGLTQNPEQHTEFSYVSLITDNLFSALCFC